MRQRRGRGALGLLRVVTDESDTTVDASSRSTAVYQRFQRGEAF